MTNEYDDLLAGDFESQRTRSALRLSMDNNPDQFAEARRLSRDTGMPADLINRNLPEVKRQVQLNEYDGLLRAAPTTRRVMGNPEIASASYDDIPVLTQLEQGLRAARAPQKSVTDFSPLTSAKAGIAGLGVAGEAIALKLDRLLTRVGSAFLPEPRMPAGGPVDASGAASASLRQAVETYNAMPRDTRLQLVGKMVDDNGIKGVGPALSYLVKNPSIVGNFVAEQLPGAVLGGVAGGAAARGAAASVGGLGGQAITGAAVNAGATAAGSFGPAVVEQFGKGQEPNAAVDTAAVKSTVEALVNAPFGALAAVIPQGDTLLRRLGNLGGQFLVQGTGGAAGAAAAAAAVGEDASAGELFLEFIGEGFTAPIDIAAAAVTSAVDKQQAQAAAGEKAKQFAGDFEKLMATAAASTTRERDVDTFAQLVQEAAEDSGSAPTEVFIDAARLVEVIGEQGIEQLRADKPELLEGFDEALALNGTVSMPMGEVMARFAGTGMEKALAQHIKLTADGYSALEADEQVARAKEELRELADQARAVESERADWEADSNAVFETLRGELKNTGRFTADVNDAYAELARDFYTVQASRMGMKPSELYARMPLRVRSTAPGGQTLAQYASSVTPGAKPGEVSVKGVHFSKEARPVLDGRFYGTGYKGAEAQRLQGDVDQRLKSRVYAYVDEGMGVRPESSSVGGWSQAVQFDNLYDISADPLGLWTGEDVNARETAILDAGYDGYYAANAFGGLQQGAAVLLGDASFAVPTTEYTPGVVARAEESPLSEADQALRDFYRDSRTNFGFMSPARWGEVTQRAAPDLYERVAPLGLFEGTQPVYKEDLVRAVSSQSQVFNQSVSLRDGRETLKRYGLKPGVRYNTREIAAALEARQRAKYGSIDPKDRSDESAKRIAKWIVEEVQFELQHPEKSGAGWYSYKFQRALDIFANEFPELATDQDARDTLTALIAITSDGQKVGPNFAQAADIYGTFRETGQFTTTRGHQRQDSILGNLERIQAMYEQLGAKGMRDFLMQEDTVAGLRKRAAEQGVEFNTQYQANVKLPLAAVVLGPKLGAFYANLMGASGYLTMDRWWSRTFNRYRGVLLQAPTREGLDRFKQLLGKPDLTDEETISATVEHRKSYEARGFKNGTEIEKAANTIYKAAFEALEDAPFNATDRSFMLKAVDFAQKSLARRGVQITVADIQAVLWYYEKRLYGELGARQSADISYEEAANRVVADRLRAAGRSAASGDAQAGSGGPVEDVPAGLELFDESTSDLTPDQALSYPLLNIGLSTAELGDGGLLAVGDVVAAVEAYGAGVVGTFTQQSDSEQTAVLALSRPLTREEGDALSASLQQEAIVQRDPSGSGELFGPMADNWGPYNPEFFVLPDGTRASQLPLESGIDIAAATDNVFNQTVRGGKPVTIESRGKDWFEAKVGSRTVGKLAVWRDSRGKLVPMNVFVSDKYRRRGIARQLYQAAEAANGEQLSPAISLSDDAFEFWKSYRPEAVAQDLRHWKDQLIGAQVIWKGRPGTITAASGGTATATREDGTTSIILRDQLSDAIEAAGGQPIDFSPVLNQSAQVDTPEFRRWFGDSKVVDDNGEPLVVYHGTIYDFDTFKPSKRFGDAYFTSESKSYANTMATGPFGETDGGNVMPVFVSLQNPRVIPFSEYNADALESAMSDGEVDGLIAVDESGVKQVIVAFDPKQIKSATGNSGAFDPNNPSILAQGNEARAQFNPATLEIALLEKADLSSFLHELGHAFFEMQAMLVAQSPNAPAEMVSDVETLMRFAGHTGTVQEWLALPVAKRREGHEKVAESFEQYLFEGKAPNLELRTLFRKLRSWMVAVYQSLARFLQTNKGAQLTDEVRGVFDRMLASEEEIRDAAEARAYGKLFQIEPNMTPEQWVEYQRLGETETEEALEAHQARSLRDMKWLDNAKGRVLRELQKDAKEKRKAIRDEVQAEVQAEPVYRAIRFLKRGLIITEEGEEVQVQVSAAHKMNLEAVKGMFPQGALGAVDFTALGYGKYGMLAKDGLHPDLIAPMFGFASGDELVRAVLNAAPETEVVEGLTDERMLSRYGDLIDSRAMEEAANEALASETHTRMVATELAAMNNAVGRKDVLRKAARQIAEDIVAGRAVRAVRPDQAAAGAARERRAAEKALVAGDQVAAATAKRNELLQLQLERVQREVRAEVEKARRQFAKIYKGTDEALAKGREVDIVKMARAVLARYGLATPRAGEVAENYLELLRTYNGPLAADLTAMTGMLPPQMDYRKLTVEQFRGVRDVALGLWQLSRSVKQITVDGQKVEVADVVDRLVAELKDRAGGELPVMPGYASTTSRADEHKAGFMGFISRLRRVEQWADLMGGAAKAFIYQPVRDAVDAYRASRNDLVRRYRDLLKSIEPSLTYTPIAAPELFDFTFKGGKVELLHAVLHSGNTSNLTKLLLGRESPSTPAWGRIDENGNLDSSRWQLFIDRMIREGVLTKADFDFAQSVWDLLEETKVGAQKAHHEMYGYYFSEITANPLTTPFGTYRGGYVPAMVDPLAAPEQAQREDQETLLNANNSFMFPSTGKGFALLRVFYNRPLELDLRVISMHLDKVARFTHIEPAVRQTALLLKNRRLATALNRTDSTLISQMLIPWLQRAARQTVSTPGAQRWTDQLANALRSRSGMILMFANLINALQQLTGFSVALLKVPAPALLRALTTYSRHPQDTAAQAAALSPWLKDRITAQSFEMQDQIEAILTDQNIATKGSKYLQRNAYFLQQGVQNVMDVIVWSGAYEHAVKKGATQKQAVRAADEAVRTTQGSFAPEDVSAFEAGTPFVRMFTQFLGYFNMLANTLGGDAGKAVQELGYKAATPRLLFIYFAGLAIPAFAAALIAEGAPDDEDDEDGDGVLDEWLGMFFGSQARTVAAMVPGLGQIAQLTAGFMDDKPFNDRLSVPVVSMLESSARAGAAALQGELFDEEVKKNEVRDTLTLIGLATGVPTGPLSRAAGYQVDVESGKKDPESTLEYATGLATGR